MLINNVIEAVLGELAQSLQATVEKDLQPVPRVMIDAEQIRKVLTNHFLNAQEAAEKGGRMQIRIARTCGL